uniref:sodium-dependent bicarbonate transport family permease n=1 Tax=Actinotalea sp. TaxID=1872145 RepID=UPI003566E5A8
VDAAGIAAHYGSVSAVTFAAALAFATTVGVAAPEAFLPALVAVLEIPGILIALAIAHRVRQGGSLRDAVAEVLAGSSMLLLLGGIVIGAVAGPAGMGLVAPVFVAPFAGVLVLFLLHLGIVAGHRLREVRSAGPFLVGFAVAMPLAAGALGASLGTLAGLSVGGAAVFGAMAASASYIAAPAAVAVSLPEANLGLALTASLAVTFPFNLAVGIPLYHALASRLG